ncbi:ASCH/PUA domain-containing protein [uncultured Caulobacter sp.]|uniref:ASCH/PUA domain-containing protein n=1 Tax=uncultured Caulobacter sp. TaxID=158749 RepID=UPI00260A6C65|nr:ASCH/PUA domain-containing protein [uncultured Caulobacter sp.]
MNRHELKTWPKYFAAVRSGQKRFEIRRNDRDFAVGDILVLREFDPASDTYTGQSEERQITFLLSEEDYGGVIHGFVAIGFGDVMTHPSAPAEGALTAEDLASWHETAAANASLRGQEARKVSDGYARSKMSVAADRHGAVADAAEAEASFHAQAARIVRKG